MLIALLFDFHFFALKKYKLHEKKRTRWKHNEGLPLLVTVAWGLASATANKRASEKMNERMVWFVFGRT